MLLVNIRKMYLDRNSTLVIYTNMTNDVYEYGFARGFITAYMIIVGFILFRRILEPLII